MAEPENERPNFAGGRRLRPFRQRGVLQAGSWAHDFDFTTSTTFLWLRRAGCVLGERQLTIERTLGGSESLHEALVLHRPVIKYKRVGEQPLDLRKRCAKLPTLGSEQVRVAFPKSAETPCLF